MRAERLYTTREMAERIGWTGNAGRLRFLRWARRFEEITGERILVRSGKGKRPRYFTTASLVARGMPGIVTQRDEVAEAMSRRLQGFDEEIARLRRSVASASRAGRTDPTDADTLRREIAALKTKLAALERAVQGGGIPKPPTR